MNIKAADLNFEMLAGIVGNTLDLNHVLTVDNGCVIHAIRKCTIRRGMVHTKYLHTTIYKPNGKFDLYREQPNGNHKLIDSGRYDAELLANPATTRARILR